MADHNQSGSKKEPPKHDPPKKEPLKNDPPKKEPLRPDHPKTNDLPEKDHPVKEHPKENETPKKEPLKDDHSKKGPPSQHPPENDPPNKESPKDDHPKKDSPKNNHPKKESPKNESLKEHPEKEPLKIESLKEKPPEVPKQELQNPEPEPLHNEPPQIQTPKVEPPKKDPSKQLAKSPTNSKSSPTNKVKAHDVVKIRLKVHHDDHHLNHGSRSSIGSRRSVHFRDGRKKQGGDDESMIDIEVSVDSIVAKGLVDIAYFETLMRDKEPWIDHNYLSGFRHIFSADEVWLQEVYCIPCGLNTTYQVTTKDENPVFYVKKSQRAIPTWFKSLVCIPTPCCRNGFKVKVFSTSGDRLVTFVRKSHTCVTQSDIVETFYGREEMYIGRIERSAHGYILKDKYQDDIYRVLQTPTSSRSFNRMSARSKEIFKGITPKPDNVGNCCSVRQKEMSIFRSDTKEVVGRVAYIQRAAGRRFFSGCVPQPKSGYYCTPDLGTNAKVLLMGVLFFLMHSGYEKYVDLPLGSDAQGHALVTTASSTSLDAKALSDASLDLLMKK